MIVEVQGTDFWTRVRLPSTPLNMVKPIDIKSGFAYNNIRRKACFSSGLTLKSDMFVNHVIDRWRTTLKPDIFTSVQLVVGRQH